MKSDVFIKYKIVFVDYDKRNSSEMEVFFFLFQEKETHHKQLIYFQIHYVFIVLKIVSEYGQEIPQSQTRGIARKSRSTITRHQDFAIESVLYMPSAKGPRHTNIITENRIESVER